MKKTRQEIAYEDAIIEKEVEILKACHEHDVCDICDGKEWCINKFSQEARNRYVEKGYGCMCGVDCRKHCKMAKECLGDN